jgi:DNA mismatch repair ATPase MutS
LNTLAEIYDLDKSIADNSFGETQYNDFTESLKFNTELSKLVKALEKYYDSNYSDYETKQIENESPMSDELEDFLDNISSKFEDNN